MWGCRAYVQVKRAGSESFELRRLAAVYLLGRSDDTHNQKGYVCLIPSLKRMVITAHVTFDETEFSELDSDAIFGAVPTAKYCLAVDTVGLRDGGIDWLFV